MNLNFFKTYVRVVETQNLSKTAKEFGVSQPAITKQIQSLEEYYSVLLLERSGRSLKTTEAGETLYQFAQEIIKAIEKTELAMEEVSESRKGKLYLSASTIPGQYILPNIIKNFKENYPNVTLSLDIGDTEEVFNQVADREVDIGVVGGWIKNRKVDGFKWIEDELVVVVPYKHKLLRFPEVKIEDLLEERWIVREIGSGTRKAVEELMIVNDIEKEDLNVYIEAGSTEVVLASVESGMGISVVSKWAMKNNYNRRIKNIKIASDEATRFFYVIYPRQKSRRKTVNNFLEYLKKLEAPTKE
ncbi:MAG TPA: selenium metabolism-associated LysR family transcriptional regulator [Syntrophomonadaceae bacterium]|nr:selenium metabolism-associated LysR family transcriptional regulator [Syntrophomonadaceae bacterium]